MKDLYVSPSQATSSLVSNLRKDDNLKFARTVKFNTERIREVLTRYNGNITSIVPRLELYRTINFNDGKNTASTCLHTSTSKVYEGKSACEITSIKFPHVEVNLAVLTLSTNKNIQPVLLKDTAIVLSECSVQLEPFGLIFPSSFIKTIKSIEYSLILADNDDMYGDKSLVSTVQKRNLRKSIIKQKVLSFFNK